MIWMDHTTTPLLLWNRLLLNVGIYDEISNRADLHNVDEDMLTIARHGGPWNWNENIGMMNRYVQDFPSGMFDVVASSSMKKFSNYTDEHDVDEDFVTILVQGGIWSNVNTVGMMFRRMTSAFSHESDSVASKKIIYLLPHRKEAYSYIFNI